MSVLSLLLKPAPRRRDLSELWLRAAQQPGDGGQGGSHGLGQVSFHLLRAREHPKGLAVGQQWPAD